jgi:hypothetical protein
LRWHLVFAVTGFARSYPQPSARFPWIDYQSRNRSPPVELSDAVRPGRTARRDLRYPIRPSAPNAITPADRKKPDGLPPRAGHRASTWRRKSPRGRWRWPNDRARGGRPAGSGPVLNDRASPEMRPALLTATGPQPPKRHPSHLGRRHNEAGWLLHVTKNQVTMVSRTRRQLSQEPPGHRRHQRERGPG